MLERQLRETTETLETRVLELEGALQKTEAEAREHAFRIQRFYAASLSDLLHGVEADLEQDPPNVERHWHAFTSCLTASDRRRDAVRVAVRSSKRRSRPLVLRSHAALDRSGRDGSHLDYAQASADRGWAAPRALQLEVCSWRSARSTMR